MPDTLQLFFWPLVGYLIGSISSAVIVSRLLKLEDPRSTGSGNPGATNVLRTGGKIAALITLTGDLAKGAIPIVLAQSLDASIPAIALTALAAFLGHLYPVFFGFNGGKGVATAIGVYFALSWQLGLLFIGTWLVIAALFRYSSLSSLIASGVTGVASFAIFNHQSELQLIGAIFMIVAFTFKRHQDNIERLKSGIESKIGQKK